jgi:O-antigen/teichoic acid export membrane protein
VLISAIRRLSGDSLARNSLLIMATTVSNGGLGYIYWMLAARSVPPDRIGTATAVISAATAVSMIANLGAGHMFIQRLPGSDTATWSRIVGAGLFLGSAATAAAATAAALVIPSLSGNFGFLDGPGGTAALITAAIAVTLTTLLDNLYVAHRAGYGMLLRNLAVAAAKIVTLFTVLAAGMHGAGAVLVSYILPTLLISLVTITVAPRRLRPTPAAPLSGPSQRADAVALPPDAASREAPALAMPSDEASQRVDAAAMPSGEASREAPAAAMPSSEASREAAVAGRRSSWRAAVSGLRAELPQVRAAITGHHLINLTQAGPAALLPVMVTARLGPDANAHFYLAWMTASMLFMVSPAVASALYAERTNSAAVSVSRAAVVVLAVVGAPAAVLLLVGGEILGLFNAGYAIEGTPLLRILVLAALPDAVANLAVAHWRSRGEFRLCRRLNLVRAITCLALAWLLLPATGITGAGAGWLAGQTAAALLVAAVALTRRGSVAGSGRCLTPAEAAVCDSRGSVAGSGRCLSASEAAVCDSRGSVAGSGRCLSASEAAVRDSRGSVAGSGRCLTPAEAAVRDSRETGTGTGRDWPEAEREKRSAVGVPQEVGKRRQAGGEAPTGSE